MGPRSPADLAGALGPVGRNADYHGVAVGVAKVITGEETRITPEVIPYLTVPLVIVPLDGGWAVIASSFGRARHPAWRANLLAHPTATLELDGRTHPVRARLTHGEERAAILRSAMAFYRGYAAYARRASQREIDIFGLRPVSQFEQR